MFILIKINLHIARGIFYGSFKSPRILVWTIGVIILILMMAIGFLGYSPKWFNINVFYFYVLLIIITLLNIFIFIIVNFKIVTLEKSLSKKENILKNFKYNQINKGLYLKKSIGNRAYSTSCGVNNNSNISDKLKEIIQELNLCNPPIYVFENLDLEITKKEILNNTKGLSGIYMIVNKITKDYYIGSASTNRLYSRFSSHVIYFKGSKIVKLAIKKYKLENFAFLILELYPNVVTKENNIELIKLEDKYLKLLLPNYNILTEAGSSFGYKHTEIDRQKMKDNYSDARRELIGNLNRGKKFSKETIEKMREKALNRAPMAIETTKKCITNTRPVVLYNLNGTIYGKYETILEAAKAINCSGKTIRRALQTEKKIVKKQWIVKDAK